jgi:polysaccharide biosynthesis/export protein
MLALLALCPLAAMAGCHAVDLYTPVLEAPVPPEETPPRELSMVSLPIYQIEPPDVLTIEPIRLIPRPPYRVGPRDVLQIHVLGTLSGLPIDNLYLVEDDGIITLGPAYGIVRIVGMTVEEAADEITRHLQLQLQQPTVSVQLARPAETEELTKRPFAVQPDGTINLGRYGMVHVSGKTVTEASLALEEHLAQYFDSPKVSVTVVGYNSKSFYVVLGSGAINGPRTSTTSTPKNQNLLFTIRGKETVLDAVSQLGELSAVSSKTMWVARPVAGSEGRPEILPVDWPAIARGGVTDTNYQLMPGDRLYIVDDNLVTANKYLANATEPIRSLLDVTSVGTVMTRTLQTMGRSYNQTRNGF